jgi:uncharacterized membrane protein YccC
VLSFTIAILVVRTYALAAVFITAIALTIASGAHRVDVGGLLIDRGVDTLIGCPVGLAVYLALTRRQEATRLTDAIADTLDAAAVTATNLGRQDATTLLARAARRDLQVATMGMLDAYDAAVGGSAPRRKSAELHLTTVVAAEQLAYRTLAACWAMQHPGTVATLPEIHPERYPAMLRGLAAAVRTATAARRPAGIRPHGGQRRARIDAATGLSRLTPSAPAPAAGTGFRWPYPPHTQ